MVEPPLKVIVVGASSGIGAELVRQLRAKNATVAAVARRQERLTELPDAVLTYVHDVTRYDEVPELFRNITHALGGLDMIVYAAGTMPAVAPTEYDFAKDRAMVETNLLGAIAWLNQAAERFGAAGHGTIVGIGSVAGDRGRYGQPVYNTTKAALATYLEALRNRLSSRDVKVVTIKPGPVATEMTSGLNLKGAMSVEKAAAIILEKSKHTGEHYLSFKHRLAFLIIRNFPSPLFRKLKI
ncbi:SDR family NAD(P)-dependent oxidoreductase [bacterium]|nr:MAG: SDR family NAD(P)-dependent oxidoreductase [bacterium]